MIKIVISSADTRNMKGIGKASGKPYDFNIQTAHAFTIGADGVVGDFPDKFEIALEDRQPPYPRGHYTLSPSAIRVSRDGKLEVKAVLIPFAAAK